MLGGPGWARWQKVRTWSVGHAQAEIDVTQCQMTLEDLYAYVDDALSDEDARGVEAELDACLACARSLARIEMEYRTQIWDYLSGRDVGLPPPSRFVQRSMAMMKARMGLADRIEAESEMPTLVQQILQGHLPQEARPAMRRARHVVDADDEEPA